LGDVKSFGINNPEITEDALAAYLELKKDVREMGIFKQSVRAKLRLRLVS
jgi:hypothetical protein